jgi:hypothetical protein
MRFSIFEFWERATARGHIGHLALPGACNPNPAACDGHRPDCGPGAATVTVLIVPRPFGARGAALDHRADVTTDALACSRSILHAVRSIRAPRAAPRRPAASSAAADAEILTLPSNQPHLTKMELLPRNPIYPVHR